MPRVGKEAAETSVIREKFQYRPLHALHFDELNRIWEADRRIPSISSRRAWAGARNLNPTNVNSWWYRRRPLAKKFKIKIPREEYELGVGVPPVIPEAEEVSAKRQEVSEFSETGSVSLSLVGTASDGPSVFLGCASDRSSLAEFDESAAYTRSSSPFQDFSLGLSSRHSTSSRSSSLPAGSSPTSTPPPCLLTFPADMSVEDEIFGSFDPFLVQTEHEEICSSTSYVPDAFSARLAPEETKRLSDTVSLPLCPTWCLSGYRIAYDGSFLGFCSCFTIDPAAGLDQLNSD